MGPKNKGEGVKLVCMMRLWGGKFRGAFYGDVGG